MALSVEYDYILIIPSSHKIDIIEGLLKDGIPEHKIVPWFPAMGHHVWKAAEIKYENRSFMAQFDRIRFKARNTSSVMVMNGIFIEGEYECDIGKQVTVIDIGMNVGAASLYFSAMENVKQVIGFEPFPDTYAQALENIALQEKDVQDKILTYNFALSDHYGTESYSYMPDFPGGMSILGEQNDNGVSIEVKDAGEVLKPMLERINGKVLVKIDCEGSEYAIFNSLDRAGCFPRINAFIMETHLGRENEIKKILKREGYSFYANKEVSGLGILFATR